MKEKILKLRNQGKVYNEISKILNCSKSVISYHLNYESKLKSLKRNRNNRKNNILLCKINSFLRTIKTKKARKVLCYKLSRLLYQRTYDFMKNKNYKGKDVEPRISVEEVINKIGKNPRCYLTGRLIDLSDSKSYHFDHIIPTSKGGENTLDNLQIACKEANFAKRDLLLDEFISLCKDVLQNHGYRIEKI